MTKPKRDPKADLTDIHRLAGQLTNGHQPNRTGDRTIIALDEILRRDTETNQTDGYPSAHGAGAHGGDIANPTLEVARQLVDDDLEYRRDQADKIHRARVGIEEHLARAREHLQQAANLSYLVHRTSQPRKPNEPTACKACTKIVACTTADPIRGGYCNACRVAWTRFKEAAAVDGRTPDRADFERSRQQETAA